MERKICPICDNPIRGRYCRTCHQFVRNPQIREVHYYLNESHPAGETACEYHDKPAKKAQKNHEMVFNPGKSGQERRKREKMAGQDQLKGKKWVFITFVLILGINFLSAMMDGPMGDAFYGAADSMVELFDGLFDGIGMVNAPQPETPEERPGYEISWDGEQYQYIPEFQELEEEAVKEAGVRCSRDHLAIDGEEAAKRLSEILKEKAGFGEMEESGYSDNYMLAGSPEDTFYNQYIFYVNGDSGESAEVCYDTATGELHTIVVNITGRDRALALTEGLLDMMNDMGGYEAEMNEQALKDLDEIGIGEFQGEEYYCDISTDGEDNYFIYLNGWSMEGEWE